MDLPRWPRGGDPGKLLAGMACRYRTRADGSGGYIVQPEERYRRTAPNLVRCKTLAGPGVKPRLADLADLEERIKLPMPAAAEHIGLLAYLYLLDLVANPDRLRRCLYRSGK